MWFPYVQGVTTAENKQLNSTDLIRKVYYYSISIKQSFKRNCTIPMVSNNNMNIIVYVLQLCILMDLTQAIIIIIIIIMFWNKKYYYDFYTNTTDWYIFLFNSLLHR